MDETVFNQLVDECVKTLDGGKKIVVSGLGKNVPVCEKFVGTMNSLGQNAVFMNTNTAVHGDLGMVKQGDLWNIVPNNSTTINLIVLQGIAIEVAKRRKVTLQDFKQNHPGGFIGESLIACEVIDK